MQGLFKKRWDALRFPGFADEFPYLTTSLRQSTPYAIGEGEFSQKHQQSDASEHRDSE
jgi:hypothetical protein